MVAITGVISHRISGTDAF
jgi:TFIIF-interacting CTD phosphatase-like protein